ncbi:MAG: hypothetical protein P8144_12480 [Gammaproteobacteria bacterium]
MRLFESLDAGLNIPNLQAIYPSHLRAIRAKQKGRQHYRHFVMRNRGFIRSDETQIDQGRLVNIVQSWPCNNQINE